MENYGPINIYIAAGYINKQVLNIFRMFLSIFIEYTLKELNLDFANFQQIHEMLKESI